MGVSWTDEMRDQLRSLWGTTPSKEIGVIMGVSKNSIIGQAHRLGLEILRKIKSGPKKGQPQTRKKRFGHYPPRIERPFVPQEIPPWEPVEGGVPIRELSKGHCRAIIGSDDFGLPLYCGGKKVEKKSWCAHHAYLYEAPKRGAA